MTIPPLGGIQSFTPPALQPPAAPPAPTAPGSGTQAPGSAAPASGGFASALNTAVSSLNDSQIQADQAAQTLANGGGDIAGAMIATEKASLQMQFAFAIRNRAISAYQQIMAMQV
jgi:flagellar hook-basal body complex protein FliE